MKISKNYIILAIFLFSWSLFLFSFTIYNSGNYLDPDFGWHIKIGELILAEKSVPHIEQINYPLKGESWVDHEWLANVLFYYIFDNFGYIYLEIVFSFLTVLILLLLLYFIKSHIIKFSKGYVSILLLEFLGLLAMAPHLGVRVQIFGILFLLLEIIILYKFSESKNYKILINLIPIFFLWANLHGSFPIGLAVLGLWFVIKIFESIFYKYKILNYFQTQKTLNKKDFINVLLLTFLSALATFLTPYGIKLYSFLSEYSNSFYLLHIAEWLPAWHYPVNYYQLIYFALIVSASIFVFPLIREKKYLPNTWLLILSFIFFILAFKSKRHFPLFFIVSFPLFIEFVILLFIQPLKELKIKVDKRYKIIFQIFVSFILFLTATLIFLQSNYPLKPFSSPLFCKSFPCEAINYLKASSHSDKRFFNNYGWGGFIIYTWPNKEIFIDGRLPIKEINGHSFLEEYYEFFNEESLANKLEEYGVEIVLLKLHPPINLNWFERYVLGLSEEKFNDKENRLQQYLIENQSWQLEYEDLISQIYVKN